MSSPPQPHPTLIPPDQLARLSRWGRVALAARAAMRVYPWFSPAPSRAGETAVADFQALDVCTTIAALAAVNGRQLSPAVTSAAAQRTMAALASPHGLLFSPSDQAVRLAGLALEWSSAPTAATGFDSGSPVNLQAAFDDLLALVSIGLGERGYEYPVPGEFFARPLWLVPRDVWYVDLARWQATMAGYPLPGFVERFQRMAEGGGIDWTEAQQRAELWVRANVPAASMATPLPASPFPAPSAGPPPSSPFAAPSAGPLPSSPFAAPSAEPLPSSPFAAPAVPPFSGPFAAPPRFASIPALPAPVELFPSPFTAAPVAPGESFPPPFTAAPVAPGEPFPPPFTSAPVAPVAVSLPPSSAPGEPFVAAPRAEVVVPLPTLKIPPPPGGAVDFNDLEPYANALAGVIDFLDSATPFTVALQGMQGSGRSVLAGMLRRRLTSKPSGLGEQPHLSVWFDARSTRTASSLTGGLIRTLAAALDLDRSVFRRHLSRLVWKLQPRSSKYFQIGTILFCVSVILLIGAGATLMWSGLPAEWVVYRKDLLAVIDDLGLKNQMNAVGGFAAGAVCLALLELAGFIFRSGRAMGFYLSNPAESAARGDLELVRKELATLIRTAVPKGSRIVIFVEDLERAGSDRAIEFLESIDELLPFPELVFVLLTDTTVLARHAEDKYREAPGAGWRHLNRFIDLQIDMPVRHAVPGESARRSASRAAKDKAKTRVRQSTLARIWGVVSGPLSRDWRGDSRFTEVIVRTMYVDPPYVIPAVVVAWLFFILPVWEFISVQQWVFPARCKRVFSVPGRNIWNYLLGLVLLGHAVLFVQTVNSIVSGLHFVILYPGASIRSVWVFLPLEMAILALVALLALGTARSAREEEWAALAAGRSSLRHKIDEWRVDELQVKAAGPLPALPPLHELAGIARVAGGEEMLIREAVAECYLVSAGQKPLERLQAFVKLALAMDQPPPTA